MFTAEKTKPSNVKIMQIFYEVKQQFPSIPDHLITSLVTSYVQQNLAVSDLIDVLKEVASSNQDQQMGRPFRELDSNPLTLSPVEVAPEVPSNATESVKTTMDQSASDINQNVIVKKSDGGAKRPNTLDVRPDKTSFDKERRLRPSEKCKDVFKLLNSPNLCDKPPRSPISAKRVPITAPKQSPTTSKEPTKKETVSTPTQTTDTLVSNCLTPSVNLSLNVNCQMGLVNPIKPKCATKVEVTPTQPWLNPAPWFQPANPDVTSPRSFTSVNLTLRPPSSTPQDPIDITSQNSNLTYSTSSFDPQRGLQSRLQITVGPGGTGSVSSVRSRPRSSYVPAESNGDVVPVRAGSLNNLTAVSPEPTVLLKQQARIERMRIELQTGYAKLVIMRQEVESLEKTKRQADIKASAEVEKQLRMEIKHLTFQCEQLAMTDKNGQFYNEIYTGPSLLPIRPAPPPPQEPPVIRRQTRGRLYYQGPPLGLSEMEGPKWNCSLCTFLNHPDLDRCEQCEMPRVLHGRDSNLSAANINLEALRDIPLAATNPNINFDLLTNANVLVRNSSNVCVNVPGPSNPNESDHQSNRLLLNRTGDSDRPTSTDSDLTFDMLKQSAKYFKKFSSSNHNNNVIHERRISHPSSSSPSSRVFESLQQGVLSINDCDNNIPNESNVNFPLTSTVSAPNVFTLNAHGSEA